MSLRWLIYLAWTYGILHITEAQKNTEPDYEDQRSSIKKIIGDWLWWLFGYETEHESDDQFTDLDISPDEFRREVDEFINNVNFDNPKQLETGEDIYNSKHENNGKESHDPVDTAVLPIQM